MIVVNQEMQTVRAELPEAAAVSLLGTFNNWSTTTTPLREVSKGVWETQLPAGYAGPVWLFVWDRARRRGRVVRPAEANPVGAGSADPCAACLGAEPATAGNRPAGASHCTGECN